MMMVAGPIVFSSVTVSTLREDPTGLQAGGDSKLVADDVDVVNVVLVLCANPGKLHQPAPPCSSRPTSTPAHTQSAVLRVLQVLSVQHEFRGARSGAGSAPDC
jgi:hypothetical protein